LAARTGAEPQHQQAIPQSEPRRLCITWALKLAGLSCVITALGVYHFAVYVPHPNQPHVLTLLDRVFNGLIATVIIASATVLGLRILNALGLGQRFSSAEAIGLAGGIGLLSLSVLTLPVGILEMYYAPVFAALLAAPILLFGTERHLLLGAARSLGSRALRARFRPQQLSFDGIVRGYTATLCGLTLALTFGRDLTMPSLFTGYDTYQYHWAIPALMLESHKLRAFPGWAHANLPFGTEMLSLVALAFQAPFAALLVLDSFLLFAAIVLFVTVRRHFSTTAAWFAATTLTTVPLLIVYTSQAMVEPALIYFGLALLATLTAWMSKALDGGELDWRLAALIGLLSGAAIATKLMGIYYVPAVVIALAIGVAAAANARTSGVARRTALRESAATLMAFALGALAMFGPWALKNWLLLGNPVYPALQAVFGSPLWNGTRDQTLASTFASFGPKSGLTARWHLYALDLFVHQWRYGEGVGFAPGFMALFLLAFASPFCWIALRRRWLAQPGRTRGGVVLLGVAALIMFSTAGLWTFSGALVERYALPYIMLANIVGAVLLAWAAERTHLPLARWLALTLLLSICSLQAWISLFRPGYSDSPDRSPITLLLGQVSETEQLRDRVIGVQPLEFWQMTDYVNQRLPRSGRLLMLGRGSGYFFEQRDYVADSGGDWVPYLVSTGRTSDGMLRELHRLGYRYIVYDADLMRWLVTTYQNKVLARDLPVYLAFQQSRLTLLASWRGIALYAVPNSTVVAVSGHVRPGSDRRRDAT
jgi:hypothetical protein